MADVTINYEGNTIATMNASGTKTLLTQGKYCTDDIEVVYVSPGGGGVGVSGTFTPVSDIRSITLTDCIGMTNIFIFPMFDLDTSTIVNRVHWGSAIVNGNTVFASSTNSGKTNYTAYLPLNASSVGAAQVSFDSTTGTYTITQAANNNYGGYLIAGKQYGYVAW